MRMMSRESTSMVYHRPECRYARKIYKRNRVQMNWDEAEYSQKLRVLELIKQKTSEVDSTIIKEVEDMLVRRAIYYFDNPKQSNDWWEMIRYYPLWIAEKYPDFKSKRLSELCKNGEGSKEKKKVKEELASIIIEENDK